jgi:hypothetical protein
MPTYEETTAKKLTLPFVNLADSQNLFHEYKKILCYASPPPNGERYPQRVGGDQADLLDSHPTQTHKFAGAYPLSGARCVGRWLT